MTHSLPVLAVGQFWIPRSSSLRLYAHGHLTILLDRLLLPLDVIHVHFQIWNMGIPPLGRCSRPFPSLEFGLWALVLLAEHLLDDQFFVFERAPLELLYASDSSVESYWDPSVGVPPLVHLNRIPILCQAPILNVRAISWSFSHD